MPTNRATSEDAADGEERVDVEHPGEDAFRREHARRGADREIRAERPRPEGMRSAYLELLKLTLCDLAGAATLSVTKSGDDRAAPERIYSRELGADELALRANGVDWPWGGLTMVGLSRLDDLQRCVESIVADDVPGDLIEAGAWRGGASILIRATLDSLGADDRTLWVADSFRGLPPPDGRRFPTDRELDLSSMDYLSAPVAEVKSNFARFGLGEGVRYVEGFFADTLPRLRGTRWSLARLDGDSYEATWLGLEALYPGLSAGGYVIVDDYLLIEECRRAVDDYRREHGIVEPIEEIDWNSIRWRRETANESAQRSDADPPPDAGRDAAPAERGRARIPTERELELERQVGVLRRGRWPMRWIRRARRSGSGRGGG